MIDEEISRSTIAISVRASKLTARGLAYALGEAAKKIRKSQAPQGKQTVKQLLRHGGEASAIDLPGRAKDFDRVARRWGVDYAIKRVEKGKYLLFFKAKQADAITGCFPDQLQLRFGMLIWMTVRTPGPTGQRLHTPIPASPPEIDIGPTLVVLPAGSADAVFFRIFH